MSAQVSTENIDKWSSLKILIQEAQERLDELRSLPTDGTLAVFYRKNVVDDIWYRRVPSPESCHYCGHSHTPESWKDTELEVDAAYAVAKPIAECEQRIEELTKQMKALEVSQ